MNSYLTHPIDLKPTLLLEDSVNSSNYLDLIVNGPYQMTNSDLPMGRFRGTIFDIANSTTTRKKLVGWQKNVSRLNKTDVALPTIISIILDSEDVIREIELHKSFRGSKGFLCSWDYLSSNLTDKMLNIKLDNAFKRRITVEEMHCFHLVEVILGIYSYYKLFKNSMEDLPASEGIHFEEEVTDCYRKDRDIYAVCKYSVLPDVSIEYLFRFQEVLDKISFDRNGNMTGLENAIIHFYINDEKIFDNESLFSRGNNARRNLLAFLRKSREEIRKRVYGDTQVVFYNTNLYPSAIMGLVTQAMGMQVFRNNYNYNMHVLTALQRSKGVPKCIGAIKNNDEAKSYFPSFKIG